MQANDGRFYSTERIKGGIVLSVWNDFNSACNKQELHCGTEVARGYTAEHRNFSSRSVANFPVSQFIKKFCNAKSCQYSVTDSNCWGFARDVY